MGFNINTKLNKIAPAMGAMVMVGAAMAASDSDTASLSVGAVVINSCAIGSGSVDFGAFGAVVVPGAGTVGVNGNNDVDSGATISIVCTNGASATIKADRIHGRITAAQLAAAKNGVYSDTVALTINYIP